MISALHNETPYSYNGLILDLAFSLAYRSTIGTFPLLPRAAVLKRCALAPFPVQSEVGFGRDECAHEDRFFAGRGVIRS